MSDAKSQSERSMEEIIASISRMIAEDGRSAPVRRAPPMDEDDDILELTEAIDEEGRVRPIPAPEAGGVAGTAGSADEPTEPVVRVGPGAPRGAVAADPAAEACPIVSPAVAQTAAAAFDELAAAARPPRPAEGPSAGAAGRTLEELVRESLRPLLREWLDRHLPAIVERLVREEIARVAGTAGPR